MKRAHGHSIRLSLAFLSLLAVLPALGIIWHMGGTQMDAASDRAKEQTAVLTAAMAAAMDSLTSRALATSEAVAALPELAHRDGPALHRYFTSLRQRNSELVSIAVLTPDGAVIASSMGHDGALGELEHSRAAIRRKELTAGKCFFAHETDTDALSFALPVSGEDGEIMAVVVAAVALPEWAVSRERLGALPGMELGILDQSGLFLAHLPGSAEHATGRRASQTLLEAVSDPGGGGRIVVRENGQRWYLAHRHIHSNLDGKPVMTVLAGIPEPLALGPARKALYGNVGVMLTLAGLSVCLALAIGEYTITRPLRQIGRAAGSIAGGYFHVRADTIGAPAEISALSGAFDAMAAELERRDAKRRRVVLALRSNRKRFMDVVRVVSDWVWEMNPEGEFTYVSSRVRDLIGFSPRRLMGKPFHGILTGGDAERFQAILPDLVRNRAPIKDLELWCLSEDGRSVCLEVNGLPLTSQDGALLGYRGVCVDVTGQRQAQEQLLRSLHEKEVLLKEVHHRVKNNLQIISSLMSLEMELHADIPEVERAFGQMRGRVRSIALIHERLYKSDDFSAVEMSGYIESLCDFIKQAHTADGRAISLSIEVEPLAVPLDRAIPMGLLLNEAVTNAFKHAFNGMSSGRVRVRLADMGASMALEVADDGVGLPEGVLTGEDVGLGMQILHALSGQIGGELSFPETKRGTTVLVTFPR